MSDVVAVALITGLITAGVAIAAGLFAIWAERIRSRGESERQRERLLAEERRIRSEAAREGRLQAAERLQNWVERYVVTAIDLAYLLMYPRTPELEKLIDDQLALMVSGPVEETSISPILAGFSDPAIMEKVRHLNGIHTEVNRALAPLKELAAKAALNEGELARVKELLEPLTELDGEVAALNAMLEKYVAGERLESE